MMTDDSFNSQFSDWKQQIESLDEKLHPIVHAEIDINAPDWEEQLSNSPHPADESGLRTEIEILFNDIIEHFESFTPGHRQAIIDLMDENDSLMYSAVIDADFDTPDGFWKIMILFVIQDQGKDTRDAIVTLGHYRKHAQQLGLDTDRIFNQLAVLASNRDKYGWGSTRNLLLGVESTT